MNDVQHPKLPVRWDSSGELLKPSKPAKPARPSEGQLADRFVKALSPNLGGKRKAPRFDAGDLIAVLAVHSITYRRKSNLHRFLGVMLREAGSL